MPKTKGCPNESCELHRNLKHFSKKDNYCSCCGTQLRYVCKNNKCYTFLEENDGDYCLRCQAEIDDCEEAIKGGIMKVGGVAVALGGLAKTKGKDIIKFTSKVLKK